MRFLFRASAPEPAELLLPHAGGTLRVRLRRSAKARRLTLRVSSATGAVTLTLPPRTELATARRFAEAQAGWIAARLTRLPERVAFRPGAVVPLRGEPHTILHASPRRGATRIVPGPDGRPAIAVHGDEAGLPGRVRRFLHAEAEADLRAAAARHAGRIGAKIARITIRDTSSRWGSCSAAGALSFSWRLILAPPLVLDYLAAHEVAHLRELNHSARFWALTRELFPRTDEAEAWLNRHGKSLHGYG